MFIIAHRGASGLEPENTIRSFKKAEEIGVDMIEFDVRQSKDGELVIIHDHDLLRLFGDPRLIQNLTLEEIKHISREHNREIPTLNEVLSNIHTDLNIHVKIHGVEEKILKQVKNFSHRVLISCTFPGVLKKFRALDEKIELALVMGSGELHLLSFINWLTKNLNLYSIHPKYSIVNAISVGLMRLSGRKINVWTVDEYHEFSRLNNLKIDGVITNCPHIYKEYEQSRNI